VPSITAQMVAYTGQPFSFDMPPRNAILCCDFLYLPASFTITTVCAALARYTFTADSSSASLPVNRDCYQKSGKGAGDGEQLKLSVVAHSMGGLIAVNAALREPLLFDGVRD